MTEIKQQEYLAWVDIETTGLDPSSDYILEVAIVFTDAHLTSLSDTIGGPAVFLTKPAFYFQKSEEEIRESLAGFSEFVAEMHTKNGLIKDLAKPDKQYVVVPESGLAYTLDDIVMDFVSAYNVPEKSIRWAGASVHFDLSFLNQYLEDSTKKYFTHRVLDVSSIKYMMRTLGDISSSIRGIVSAHEAVSKETAHRALPDVMQTISEYHQYLNVLRSVAAGTND